MRDAAKAIDREGLIVVVALKDGANGADGMLVLVVAAQVVKGVGLGVVAVGAGVVNGERKADTPAAVEVLKEGELLDMLNILNLEKTSGGTISGRQIELARVDHVSHGFLNRTNKARGCILDLVIELEGNGVVDARVCELLKLELHGLEGGVRGLASPNLGLVDGNKVGGGSSLEGLLNDEVGVNRADAEAAGVHREVLAAELQDNIIIRLLLGDSLDDDLSSLALVTRLVEVGLESLISSAHNVGHRGVNLANKLCGGFAIGVENFNADLLADLELIEDHDGSLPVRVQVVLNDLSLTDLPPGGSCGLVLDRHSDKRVTLGESVKVLQVAS